MGGSDGGGFGAKALSWLRRHPVIEALLWFVGAFACIAVLVWFFGFSGFGNPPEFVYEQF
ncbi:hypothetical protein [Parvibacter caecicola]|uniref:Teichoic acid D-Ala incorporation-associated protein DltX n=1 Tax=Parvibacter caecicola TaxID=747645 RepID=A0A7W5D211_9ACTN|nr:hypothetical protein [Parvibacter caecicola]MBB3171223.1 hypothetical protein [Parvibacter caecicola]MCR2041986.1 hypothetical protein [Parvibacter caecicola]RNL09821.1 hypothetical protein DMP11_08135 [Parvibacter caecicola]